MNSVHIVLLALAVVIALAVAAFLVLRNNPGFLGELGENLSEDLTDILDWAENIDDRIEAATLEQLEAVRGRALRVIDRGETVSREAIQKANQVIQQVSSEIKARLRE
jgi:phosphoribosylamine-glycine ligase